jgi:hypothetical protein
MKTIQNHGLASLYSGGLARLAWIDCPLYRHLSTHARLFVEATIASTTLGVQTRRNSILCDSNKDFGHESIGESKAMKKETTHGMRIVFTTMLTESFRLSTGTSVSMGVSNNNNNKRHA